MNPTRLTRLFLTVWVSLLFLVAFPSNLVNGGLIGPGIPVTFTLQVLAALTHQPHAWARISPPQN